MTTTATSQPAGNVADTDEGDLLVWILAWSELVAFGALLAAFVAAGWLHPADFEAGRAHLHQGIPVLNTIVLLTSGWLAASAASPTSRSRLQLLGAAAGGLLFVVIKLYEYQVEGISIVATDTFTQLYLLLTGFHLAHVFFGSLILTIVACFPNRQNAHLISTLWHVIDIVWLVMLPVVYLI